MENNTVDLAFEYRKEVARALILTNVIFSIVISLGAVCNFLVLIAYVFMMKRDQLESRYFIPILSLYDLLVCIASGTYFIEDTYFWVTFESDILCKFILFFVGHTMMASDSFLLAIAIQRYIKIYRPFGKQMTFFWRRLTVFLVILLSLIYTIPTGIVSGVKDVELVYKGVNISGPGCRTGSEQYPLFQRIYYSILIVIIITNIVITAGLYTPIACVIYKTFYNKATSRQQSDMNTNSKERQFTPCEGQTSGEEVFDNNNINPRRATKKSAKRRITPKANFNAMFFTIIAVYVLSYVPTCVMLVLLSVNDTFWIDLPIDQLGIYSWLIRSYAFNHAINPFIYAYFDIRFRQLVVSVFKRETNIQGR